MTLSATPSLAAGIALALAGLLGFLVDATFDIHATGNPTSGSGNADGRLQGGRGPDRGPRPRPGAPPRAVAQSSTRSTGARVGRRDPAAGSEVTSTRSTPSRLTGMSTAPAPAASTAKRAAVGRGAASPVLVHTW